MGVLIATVIAVFLVWQRGSAPPTLSDMAAESASYLIDRRVAATIDFQREHDGWQFACGTITEADGAPLDITDLESDTFCALVDPESPELLTAFDFGSTDMPAIDWMEVHGFPPELLSAE